MGAKWLERSARERKELVAKDEPTREKKKGGSPQGTLWTQIRTRIEERKITSEEGGKRSIGGKKRESGPCRDTVEKESYEASNCDQK